MLFELQNELREHLNQDESILWAGRPKTGIIFRQIDIFLIPFSILWSGFVTFWIYITYTSGAPLFFIFFSVPFVLVGLFLLFGRFFYDVKQRENTIYGLTEKRIIIKSGIYSRKIQSIALETLPDIQYREKQDGSGTILLGKSWIRQSRIIKNYKLDLIPDVKKVFNKITEQQRDL